MIWLIPWAVIALIVRALFFLSWVFLPRAIHARVRALDLCRWGKHDWHPWSIFARRCSRCKVEEIG